MVLGSVFIAIFSDANGWYFNKLCRRDDARGNSGCCADFSWDFCRFASASGGNF